MSIIILMTINLAIWLIGLSWMRGYEEAVEITILLLITLIGQIIGAIFERKNRKLDFVPREDLPEMLRAARKQSVKEFADFLKDYARQVKENGYDGIGENDIEEKLKEYEQ